MNPAEQMADHLGSVYRDGAWSEVAVRDVLQRLTGEAAAAHTIPGAHSAWEILLHIDAWHRAIARRLQGEVVDLSDEEDWPSPPEPTEASWQAALERLDAGVESLLSTVRGLSPESLSKKLPGNPYSAYPAIHGIAEHDLYHSGQVVFLSKAAR